MKYVFYFLILLVLLTACDDESPSQVNHVHAKIADTVKELAQCNDDNEGDVAWVKGERSARVCAKGEWLSTAESTEDTVVVAGYKVYTKDKRVECSIEILEDENGVKLICYGDSVGFIPNGVDGEDGVDGKNGKNGSDGKDGKPGDKGEKGVPGDSGAVGASGKNGSDGINGDDGKNGEDCKLVADTDGKVVISCGSEIVELYKAFCGAKPYDPETHFCDSRDERIYRYVTIGSQVWMAENLNYVIDYETDSLSGFSWCSPDADSCERFGRYYSWSVAMDAYEIFSDNGRGCFVRTKCMAEYPVRGICPKGWHLPDTTDWSILDDFVNDDYRALQAKGFPAWALATDEYGFSVLPTGFLYRRFGNVVNIGNVGTNMAFWTITESDADKALAWDIDDHRLPAFRSYEKINMAYPIRCLRDDSAR